MAAIHWLVKSGMLELVKSNLLSCTPSAEETCLVIIELAYKSLIPWHFVVLLAYNANFLQYVAQHPNASQMLRRIA